jgi:hypothetical protein
VISTEDRARIAFGQGWAPEAPTWALSSTNMEPYGVLFHKT